ncbi:MAG: UDP-N-acetylmuramate--L-alanine ligase [Anaerovoracaceae bacterium]|jgi:UDP-N-acetylmuramate--alanine ligase
MIDFSSIKTIHCIGIGGIGLSAIADILLARGYRVTGSDMNQSEKVEQLMRDGATVYLGHRARNIGDADLLVYSSAVAQDNPELTAAREKGIPCITRAQMLGILMQGHDVSIAIAGTHGKTTTTSMLSLILMHAEMDPTILVGGNLAELGGNVRVGHSEYFVTEACEYMDSFLELRPNIEIILNIDSDHLDYFKDIEHIIRSFDKFADLVPGDGIILAYGANPFVKRVIKDRGNVITYGFDENNDYYADDIGFDKDGKPFFTIYHDGGRLLDLQLDVPGEHNLLNALVAAACAHCLQVPLEVVKSTLESFHGTQRRFDVLGETVNGNRVIDDYAHHPTEIRATLEAAGKMYHNELWCVFQPHTYTRTIALFEEFPAAFEKADKIVLAEIYAAREKNIHKISSKALAKEIKKVYPDKDVYFFKDLNEIANFVYDNSEPDDMIITMGAGDVYKVGEQILALDGVGAHRGAKIND